MRLIYIFFILLLSQVFAVCQDQGIETRLKELSEVYLFTYQKMDVDTFFKEKYMLMIEQPLDHDKPDGPTFNQRVFLNHKSTEQPVVFITEGYAASYAVSPYYINELSTYLQANQICVEHRFFGESVPDSLDWSQLTVANSADDLHHVNEILKNIYDAKWVSTGISKGGQTSTYYRYFYPEDVDISVPYVAPLNFSSEDLRVYRFLNSVGTRECRDKILAFQSELLKNKNKYLPVFEKLAQRKSLTYKIGMEKAFELIVLEYSFAFWQWGNVSCTEIPENFNNAEKLIAHLNEVAGISWTSNQSLVEYQPFFYQAMRELGFYGYDIEPFKEWVSFTTNPTFEFTLPEGVSAAYEPELNKQVDYFVRHQAENMLYIYGEYDAWSSTSVDLTYSNNLVKIVKPGGSHSTRINNLPQDQKETVLETLNSWLKTDE